MKQCRTQKVTVVGAVNAPGCHQLPRGASSLLAAINAAGGLSKEAGTEIEIRHTDSREASTQQPQASSVANNSDGSDKSVQLASFEQTIPNTGLGMTKIDLQAAAAGSIRVPDLHDGDVVNVARRKLPSVYVLGLVRKPGEIKFPTNQELRMLDALAMAGGVSNPVAEEVLVIRKVQNSPDPVRISVSIQDAKNGNENIALAPGDMVTVEQTPATVAIDIVQTVVRFSVGGSLNWF
jgi:polysaccharide export outer membrane protein